MGRDHVYRDVVKRYIALNLVFLIYSFCSVCSKSAALSSFLSLKFFLFYGLEIALLGFYAIAWQQVIKHMPLTVAFSNKGITVLWAMLWGRIFFGEPITLKKIIGILIVISGIVLFSNAGESDE